MQNNVIIIAIYNEKGGSGKTTSAVSIAAGLTKLGKKSLIIDLDSQANSTTHLGYVNFLELIWGRG